MVLPENAGFKKTGYWVIQSFCWNHALKVVYKKSKVKGIARDPNLEAEGSVRIRNSPCVAVGYISCIF